ncbi:MAG: DUF5989 family protein [Opitutales bacterium]|jgi:hypothetical protein|nr:DUF5989 family protein [Opitutales bacterium]
MSDPKKPSQKETFLDEAAQKRGNIITEFLHFLRHNKKWWMLPIIIILLLLGLLVMLSGSAIAPFLYPLF